MNAQTSIYDLSAAPASASSADPDSFGCCSRYNECSDARHCVLTDKAYAAHCAYRKSLEAGHIFYGKNADGFSEDQYAALLHRINALPSAVRTAFDALVLDFCEYHRGASRCIVRNAYISQLSAVDLFTFQPLGAAFVDLCAYRSYLLPQFKDTPVFRQAQARRKAEIKQLNDKAAAARSAGDAKKAEQLDNEHTRLSSPGTVDFMRDWLNHEAIKLRDILAEPYRFAQLRAEQQPYLEAYYRDTLYGNSVPRIYVLSPLAADGLLPAFEREDEELRRVKLSNGYSPEEKARRIAEIERARAGKRQEDGKLTNGSKSPKRSKNASYENFFSGKLCVITGSLSIPRTDAFLQILKCGGSVSDAPVNSMDVLILGHQEWSEWNGGVASRKVQKAVDLQEQGRQVAIISEDEFLTLVKQAMPCD